MEFIMLFLKSLPVWLSAVVEVMVVTVLFTASVLVLWGIYIGIAMVVLTLTKRNHCGDFFIGKINTSHSIIMCFADIPQISDGG